MDVSFIIPAFNEEEKIGSTIRSIQSSLEVIGGRLGRPMSYEIIVVDNGSTDRTIAICQSFGVEPLVSLATTIGALRNHGAGRANGLVYVFLDADISLLPGWAEAFVDVFKMVQDSVGMISGSKVLPSGGDSFVARTWFGEGNTTAAYMNSAHLIIHRDFFARLSGFDESLISGEDSDLSRRALLLGGRIVPMPHLRAAHHGVPTTLGQFFQRERWHGHGDFQSLEILRKSRPSQLALINVASAAIALLASVAFIPWSLLGYIAVLGGMATLAAFHRCNCRLEKKLPALIMLYVIYITARSVSFIDFLTSTRPARWR